MLAHDQNSENSSNQEANQDDHGTISVPSRPENLNPAPISLSGAFNQSPPHQNHPSNSNLLDEKKTVFMIGLPTTTNHSFFKSWFCENFPEFKFKKIIFPKKKKKMAYAFIEFEDEMSRNEILSLPHIKFQNRELKFQPYRTGKKLKKFRNEVQKRRLFVHGLKPFITKNDLQKIFSEFGELDDAYLIKNLKTGRSKCFGYVIFKDKEVAEYTAKIGSLDYKGIVVRFKLHQKKSKNKGNQPGNIGNTEEYVKKNQNFEERNFEEYNVIEEDEEMPIYHYQDQVDYEADHRIDLEYDNRRFYDRKLSLEENKFRYREFIDFQEMRPYETKYFKKRGFMKHFDENLDFHEFENKNDSEM